MNHAYTLFARHAVRSIAAAEDAMQRIRIGMQRDDDEATIAAADAAGEFAGLLHRRAPSAGRTYAPLRMRRRESACGPWTLHEHLMATSEACGRAMTCNGHAADLRAYAVARHYARSLARL